MRQAYQRALAWLGRRDYAVAELRYKLQQVGFTTEEIQVALEQLGAQQLIDDQRYAELFIRAKTQQGYGPRWILQALQAKGVSVDCTIFFADHDYEAVATKVLQKRRTLTSQQGYRLLQRRGFNSDVIRTVLRLHIL